MCIPGIQNNKRDETTSISAIKLSSNDENAKPDHSLRKTNVGRRREYADRPTSAPSIANVKIAEIQTEPKRVTVEESQASK